MLKRDPVAFNDLKRMESQAAKVVADSPAVISNAAGERKLFNKVIVFPRNSLSIKSAEIISKNGSLSLMLKQTGEQTITYPLGMGAAYKFYQIAASGHLYALRAYWKDTNEFEIEFNMLSKINKYLIDFKIGDNKNEVLIKERTHQINEVFPVSIRTSRDVRLL